MRKHVGVLMAALLYASGLVSLSRWWMRRSGPRLIILNYHRARGGDLRRHLLYLRRHYRLLHLEQALEELAAPPTDKMQQGRRTPLVLTFDDGYADAFTDAFPLVRELQVPITIFLIPGYVESGDYFWWGEGRRFVQETQQREVEFNGVYYSLAQSVDRSLLAQEIDACLRQSSSVAERERRLAQFRQLLAVPGCAEKERREEEHRPLTWTEICTMQESGWVSFGAHTMNHPVLAHLSDPAEVQYEVGACRTVLMQRLARPIRVFAYPIGRAEHIGDAALKAVREAGYAWAVTTMHGVNTSQSNPLLLGRVLGDVSRHWLVMAAETSGVWSLLSPLWKAFLGQGESA